MVRSEMRERSLENGQRTLQLLVALSPTAERAQAGDELLEVDRPTTAARALDWVSSTPSTLCASSGLRKESERGTHSSSKMAIIRLASGLVAICGIWRNSSLSIVPLPSRSSFMKRFLRRWISTAETERCEGGDEVGEGEEERKVVVASERREAACAGVVVCRQVQVDRGGRRRGVRVSRARGCGEGGQRCVSEGARRNLTRERARGARHAQLVFFSMSSRIWLCPAPMVTAARGSTKGERAVGRGEVAAGRGASRGGLLGVGVADWCAG